MTVKGVYHFISIKCPQTLILHFFALELNDDVVNVSDSIADMRRHGPVYNILVSSKLYSTIETLEHLFHF